MLSETYRPDYLESIAGHDEAKSALVSYLQQNPRKQACLLTGSPGIGKTTLVLAAARSCGYEPLEVNASRSVRSHEDVDKLKDGCLATVSFVSFVKHAQPRKTCLILDEVDGSDPHAQRRLLEWIRDESRRVPILMTANELPIIFKRAKDSIVIHRCMPVHANIVYESLRHHLGTMTLKEFQSIMKECHHDIRRILHRIQYGKSDTCIVPTLTGDTILDLLRQEEMFYKTSPIDQVFSAIETE
jgi:DNA polymerase III delta prime subunit